MSRWGVGHPKNYKPERHSCILFKCRVRDGHYCCQECPKLKDCEKACLNSPEACGYHRPTREKEGAGNAGI